MACLRPIIIEYTLHTVTNFHVVAFRFQALHQLIIYLDPGPISIQFGWFEKIELQESATLFVRLHRCQSKAHVFKPLLYGFVELLAITNEKESLAVDSIIDRLDDLLNLSLMLYLLLYGAFIDECKHILHEWFSEL